MGGFNLDTIDRTIALAHKRGWLLKRTIILDTVMGGLNLDTVDGTIAL